MLLNPRGESRWFSLLFCPYTHAAAGRSCVLRAANVIYGIIQRAGKTGKWSDQEKIRQNRLKIRAERREKSGFEQR